MTFSKLYRDARHKVLLHVPMQWQLQNLYNGLVKSLTSQDADMNAITDAPQNRAICELSTVAINWHCDGAAFGPPSFAPKAPCVKCSASHVFTNPVVRPSDNKDRQSWPVFNCAEDAFALKAWKRVWIFGRVRNGWKMPKGAKLKRKRKWRKKRRKRRH